VLGSAQPLPGKSSAGLGEPTSPELVMSAIGDAGQEILAEHGECRGKAMIAT
jgi:hypothetical protein